MTSIGNASRYFVANHLGSTNALTNSTGVITSSATYDSFGNQTGNLATRYSYTGREYDSFTGLNYYRNRWYDANIGRFISEDPIGFEGGDINLYGYTRNRVVNRKDPLGLDDTEEDFPSSGIPPGGSWIPGKKLDPLFRNPTFGGELGLFGHGGFFGYGASLGWERNLRTGQTCLFWKWNMRTGLGAFAGGGGKISFGEGPDRQSDGEKSYSEELGADVGKGVAAKLKLKGIGGFSSSGQDLAIGGGGGGGIGASIGGDAVWKTIIKCWNNPCED